MDSELSSSSRSKVELTSSHQSEPSLSLSLRILANKLPPWLSASGKMISEDLSSLGSHKSKTQASSTDQILVSWSPELLACWQVLASNGRIPNSRHPKFSLLMNLCMGYCFLIPALRIFLLFFSSKLFLKAWLLSCRRVLLLCTTISGKCLARLKMTIVNNISEQYHNYNHTNDVFPTNCGWIHGDFSFPLLNRIFAPQSVFSNLFSQFPCVLKNHLEQTQILPVGCCKSKLQFPHHFPQSFYWQQHGHNIFDSFLFPLWQFSSMETE